MTNWKLPEHIFSFYEKNNEQYVIISFSSGYIAHYLFVEKIDLAAIPKDYHFRQPSDEPIFTSSEYMLFGKKVILHNPCGPALHEEEEYFYYRGKYCNDEDEYFALLSKEEKLNYLFQDK